MTHQNESIGDDGDDWDWDSETSTDANTDSHDFVVDADDEIFATPAAAAPVPPPVRQSKNADLWWSGRDKYHHYIVDSNGVREIMTTKYGAKDVSITNFPILPIGLIKSVDDDNQYIELEYVDGDGNKRKRVVSTGQLSRVSSDDLPGYVVPDGRVRQKLGDALMQIYAIRQKAGEIKVRFGSARGGWSNQAEAHVRPGDDIFIGNVVALCKTLGDQKVWFDTMAEMITDSPLCALTISSAYGSYMRGLIVSDVSHIQYWYGERGRGKSTILHAAASIQGNPNKGEGSCFFDGVSTLVGVENLLAASNHGFLCLDELDDIFSTNNDDGVKKLMYFSNGGGRAKSDRSQTGGVSIGVTWDCTLICSGNTDINDNIKGHRKAGAVGQRVVQIDIGNDDLRTFKSVDKITDWSAAIAKNYGWGYKRTREILANKNVVRDLKDLARATFDDLLQNGFGNDKQREAKYLVYAYLGAKIARLVHGDKVGDHCDQSVSIMQNLLADKVDRDDSQTDDVDSFKSWLASNVMRFRVKGYMYDCKNSLVGVNDQEQFADDCTKMALEKGNALGLIVQPKLMQDEYDFSGKVYLSAQGREVAERAGVRIQEVISIAKRQGWFNPGEGRNDAKKFDTKTGIGKEIGQARAYFFDFSAICPF